MAALSDFLQRWHIILRCTICGPMGPLFFLTRSVVSRSNFTKTRGRHIHVSQNQSRIEENEMPFKIISTYETNVLFFWSQNVRDLVMHVLYASYPVHLFPQNGQYVVITYLLTPGNEGKYSLVLLLNYLIPLQLTVLGRCRNCRIMECTFSIFNV